MASAGLPALSGFPGEFLVLLGTFTAGKAQMVWAICAATGVILAAIYLLWMVQKVLFGPLQNPANENLKDMNGREIFVLAPLMVLALYLGIRPNVILKPIAPAVEKLVADVNAGANRPNAPDRGALRHASVTPPPSLKAAVKPFDKPLRLEPRAPRIRGALDLPVKAIRAGEGR